MSKNTVIIDYGLGNLYNLKHTLDHLSIDAIISNKSNDILNAERIILPGVGAFAAGMDGLRKKGLIKILDEYAESEKPMLGICLGMQLLMKSSKEHGNHEGLGYVDGKVFPFNPIYKNKIEFKVPQIGWNSISLNSRNKKNNEKTILNGLFDSQNNETYMYFIHSYYIQVEDSNDCLATTFYANNDYCSVLKKNNIHGVQFHPELSGSLGLTVLKNFSKVN